MNGWMMTGAVFSACAFWLATHAARAENIAYPDDASHVNITLPPYNACGDGKTDCTAAIQQALIDHQGAGTLYFPDGTYLVSNTIE